MTYIIDSNEDEEEETESHLRLLYNNPNDSSLMPVAAAQLLNGTDSEKIRTDPVKEKVRQIIHIIDNLSKYKGVKLDVQDAVSFEEIPAANLVQIDTDGFPHFFDIHTLEAMIEHAEPNKPLFNPMSNLLITQPDQIQHRPLLAQATLALISTQNIDWLEKTYGQDYPRELLKRLSPMDEEGCQKLLDKLDELSNLGESAPSQFARGIIERVIDSEYEAQSSEEELQEATGDPKNGPPSPHL